jgi:putative acetyltransferase
MAKAAGLESLRLSATLNSVAFYEAAGYKQEQKTQYRHPSGLLLDCVRMEKQLPGGDPPAH